LGVSPLGVVYVDLTQPRLAQLILLMGYSASRRFEAKRPQILELLAKSWPRINVKKGEIELSSPEACLEAQIGPEQALFRAESIQGFDSLTDVLSDYMPAELWAELSVGKFEFLRCHSLLLCPQSDYDSLLSQVASILAVSEETWTVTGGPPDDLSYSLVFVRDGLRFLLWFTPMSADQLKVEYRMTKQVPKAALHIMCAVTATKLPVKRVVEIVNDTASFAQTEGLALAGALFEGEDAIS